MVKKISCKLIIMPEKQMKKIEREKSGLFFMAA
jgi:hypothetical protein